MTVCPCCGFKFEGDLQRDGCASCGARAVGPALSRPVRELPSYGRSLFVGVTGGVMLATFLVSTLSALFERGSASFGFWSIMGAAETAAWRLKWVAIPATIFALWTGVAHLPQHTPQPAPLPLGSGRARRPLVRPHGRRPDRHAHRHHRPRAPAPERATPGGFHLRAGLHDSTCAP